ncbi:MAG: tetratricopeptide repeat protein [Betaproteobacteria bacterium]|nr:tetratricopeptide repeat protein [Betaproteobacteria bacterium]
MRASTLQGDTVWQPVMHALLARVYAREGRTEQAIESAHQAVMIARNSDEMGHEAWVHYTEGMVLAAHAPTDAQEALRESLRLARELEMRPLEARCMLEMGLLSCGSIPGRHDHLSTAARMFKDMDMKFWQEKTIQAQSELGGNAANR